MTLAAFGFSFLTLNWDKALNQNPISAYPFWQGGAEGARQLLSTIAGSVITITGVVFSITFEGLVDASFNQLRQYGSSNLSILIHLLETLSSILSCTQNQDQKSALEKHAKMIKAAGNQLLEERDRQDIQDRFDLFNSESKHN